MRIIRIRSNRSSVAVSLSRFGAAPRHQAPSSRISFAQRSNNGRISSVLAGGRRTFIRRRCDDLFHPKSSDAGVSAPSWGWPGCRCSSPAAVAGPFPERA